MTGQIMTGRRLGHGPFGWWPPPWWRTLFYDPRPNLHVTKTRVPEWSKLQSEQRFFQALFCFVGPPSHILWNIKWPWLGVMFVSCMMPVYHYLEEQYVFLLPNDTGGVLTTCFRLTNFAMSLLLAIRLNRTYERWNQARSSVAGVGNGSISVFMQAAIWVKDPKLIDQFRRFSIVWPYAIMQVVTSSKTLDPRASKLLHPEEMAVFTSSTNRWQVVVTKIRQLAHDANLPMEQFMSMETAIAGTWKSAGDALRIRSQAMPHGLSLVCTGFVLIWCLLLPLGIWSAPSEDSFVPMTAMALISMLLLGADELANQMEEPFSLMPLDEIISTYERDINRISDELCALRQAEVAVQARKAKEASTAEAKAAELPKGAATDACTTAVKRAAAAVSGDAVNIMPATSHRSGAKADGGGAIPVVRLIAFAATLEPEASARAGASQQQVAHDIA